MMIMLACAVLAIGLFIYVFWPARNIASSPEKTRLMYLEERKEMVYENLRDLNFEYKAGKIPEGDYANMRAGLEDEAAAILREMEVLRAQNGGSPALKGARS